MQKNLMLISTAIIFSLALAIFTNEGLIYLSAVLMAVAVMVALRYFKAGIRITRWANENPRKAQVFITLLQMFILSIGLIVGYDLKQLGYKFTDTAALVFAALMVTGFFSVQFFRKRRIIALPINLHKDRVAYTGIIVAAYCVTVITGNKIEDKYPNTILADVLRSIDQEIFSQNNILDNEHPVTHVNNGVLRNQSSLFGAFPALTGNEKLSEEPTLSKKEARTNIKAEKKLEKLEKMKKRMMRRIERLRRAFAAGASAGTVLLIILLVLAVCAGICLIVAGFSGGGAVPVVIGVVVTGAAIWGIVDLSKKNKAHKKNSQ